MCGIKFMIFFLTLFLFLKNLTQKSTSKRTETTTTTTTNGGKQAVKRLSSNPVAVKSSVKGEKKSEVARKASLSSVASSKSSGGNSETMSVGKCGVGKVASEPIMELDKAKQATSSKKTMSSEAETTTQGDLKIINFSYLALLLLDILFLAFFSSVF